MPGFQDSVKEAWSKPVNANRNPMNTIHIKLSRTAKSLRRWAKSLISEYKVALVVCMEVIDQLERAQEGRQLTIEERNLIKNLKHRDLRLVVIERCRARQKIKDHLA
jgi:hypothetical protein